MHKMYSHLCRSAFHMGLSALRQQLHTSTESQVKAKAVLGVSGCNVSWKEYAEIREGKMILTAILNVYANVRGKASAHKVDKFPSAAYLYRRDNAQHFFDEAVELWTNAEVATAELAAMKG